jgi:type II secretory pathway pseudopilin PulG
MKPAVRKNTGFSLLEIVIALGVAAFCLMALAGMLPIGIKTQRASANQTRANGVMSQCVDFLRADVRLPPGQAKKAQGDWQNLNGHWQSVAVPDTLFFSTDGKQIGYGQGATPGAPAGAVYRGTITYLFPPTATTSIAKIIVSWPAAQTDLTKVEGSIEMFAAVNR